MSHNNQNDEDHTMSPPCHKATAYKARLPICPAYCDCFFPTARSMTFYKGHIPDIIKCRCGEDDPETHTLHWNWHQDSLTDALINGPNITFHPTYSQGTAIVRGEKSLEPGMIHFWEMRMLTVISGTDMMFGIGSDQVDLNQFKFHFISALGTNSQSWGLSYEGKIQHIGIQSQYAQKFSQGCIVGVLLDRVRGELEFFLNRRSLGVAYRNIPIDPSVKIYPMISSTPAKSSIRLINATSQVENLQLRAFRALSKQPQALQELTKLPGLKPVLRNYWFLAPPVRYSRESKANEYDMLDEAVLSTKSRLSRKHKFNDDDSDDFIDLYSNAHKIAVHQQNDHEEAFPLTEYFDEYFDYLF